MDSTLPLLPSSKLPVKRKTPDSHHPTAAADGGGATEPGSDPKNPPFKFHRIWTEPDEIRFLQGLLNGSSDNLVFPRDINVFYTRFSNTMSQPYTKSQLSEKLRRLRKKFRVISSRLVKGLDMSLLSPHDRELYHLSKQLWHPDFAHTSPFNADKSRKICVSDPGQDRITWVGSTRNEENIEDDEKDDGDGKLREVNVELDRGEMGEERVEFSRLDGPVQVGVGYGIGIGDIAAKVVMDVFDDCLKDLRNGVLGERSNVAKKAQSDSQRLNLDKKGQLGAQRSNFDDCGNGVVGEGDFGDGVVGERSNVSKKGQSDAQRLNLDKKGQLGAQRSNFDDCGNGVVGEGSNLGDFGDGVVGERSNLGDFTNGVVGERPNVDGFRDGVVVRERSNLGDFGNGVVGERLKVDGFRNGVVGERSNVDGFRNEVVGERSNVDGFRNEVVGERSNVDAFRNEVVGERSNVDGFRNEVVGESSNLDGFRNEVVGERSNVDGFRNEVVGESSNLDGFRNGVVGERSSLGGFLKEASLDEFDLRWREQRVAELDVLARRMRLVFEYSLQSR